MDLKTYLEENDITAARFARMLGIHANTIYFFFNGRRNLSYELATLIHKATKKEVPMNLLYNKEKLKKRCPTCKRIIRKEKTFIDK